LRRHDRRRLRSPGHFDLFSSSVTGSDRQLTATAEIGPSAAGAVVEVRSHTFYYDALNRPTHYDAGFGNGHPVVDNVAGLTFDYFGDRHRRCDHSLYRSR
jgi:hypothetical protein